MKVKILYCEQKWVSKIIFLAAKREGMKNRGLGSNI